MENSRHKSLDKIQGIRWNESDQTWRVSIFVNKKSIKLGRYFFLKDAQEVYLEAAQKHFGEFAPSLGAM